MNKLWSFIALSLIAISTGCRSTGPSAIFNHSIWGDAAEAKTYLDAYKHVLLVCIYEDHWEDRGPHEYSLHHFKGTVARIYKGSWSISEKIAFVHGADFPALTNSNAFSGKLMFVFANEHKETEIGLDTGDSLLYEAELERQIQFVFPKP